MQAKSKHQEREEKQQTQTSFECHAPEAKAVFLVGTFNDWDPLATPMERAAEGSWRTPIHLPAGRYEYKFIIDGQWYCEPDQDRRGGSGSQRDCVSNPFGTSNYVIEVTAGVEKQERSLNA